MKLVTSVVALAVAAVFTTACDRPKTQSTAYNNSGASATPGSSTTGTTAPTSSTTTSDSSAAATTTAPGSSSSPTSGDTTASTAGTQGAASSGAMGETVTTGKIKAAIAADSGMKDADISVTTNSGVVVLSGTVKSQDQVAIATNLAQKQEGVSRVESNITVR